MWESMTSLSEVRAFRFESISDLLLEHEERSAKTLGNRNSFAPAGANQVSAPSYSTLPSPNQRKRSLLTHFEKKKRCNNVMFALLLRSFLAAIITVLARYQPQDTHRDWTTVKVCIDRCCVGHHTVDLSDERFMFAFSRGRFQWFRRLSLLWECLVLQFGWPKCG